MEGAGSVEEIRTELCVHCLFWCRIGSLCLLDYKNSHCALTGPGACVFWVMPLL